MALGWALLAGWTGAASCENFEGSRKERRDEGINHADLLMEFSTVGRLGSAASFEGILRPLQHSRRLPSAIPVAPLSAYLSTGKPTFSRFEICIILR